MKHKLNVPCKGFEEQWAQTTTFSNTPSHLRGTHFLVHGTEKEFTPAFMHIVISSNI